MSDPGDRALIIDLETEHAIKNHLAVISGFCELLLADTAADDPRRGDLLEVSRSAQALVVIFRGGLRR